LAEHTIFGCGGGYGNAGWSDIPAGWDRTQEHDWGTSGASGVRDAQSDSSLPADRLLGSPFLAALGPCPVPSTSMNDARGTHPNGGRLGGERAKERPLAVERGVDVYVGLHLRPSLRGPEAAVEL
jgi:hypothetical protein